MTMSDTTLLNLAAKLTDQPLDQPGYLVKELITGLGIERLRLGRRPFVVTLYQNDFDYDGLTDSVFLLDSFDSQADAMAFAELSAGTLLKAQTASQDSMGKKWSLESEGEIHALPKPKENSLLRAESNRTYKLRASEYDTLYNCFRVIGPLADFAVCEGLFDFLNCKTELWHYFVKVGESTLSDKPLPTLSPQRSEDAK